jgi:hypothetical protein
MVIHAYVSLPIKKVNLISGHILRDKFVSINLAKNKMKPLSVKQY